MYVPVPSQKPVIQWLSFVYVLHICFLFNFYINKGVSFLVRIVLHCHFGTLIADYAVWGFRGGSSHLKKKGGSQPRIKGVQAICPHLNALIGQQKGGVPTPGPPWIRQWGLLIVEGRTMTYSCLFLCNLVSCGELSHWQSYHIFFFILAGSPYLPTYGCRKTGKLSCLKKIALLLFVHINIV